jgi:hypothetical protein
VIHAFMYKIFLRRSIMGISGLYPIGSDMASQSSGEANTTYRRKNFLSSFSWRSSCSASRRAASR